MIIEFLQPIIEIFLENPYAQGAGFIGMLCVWSAFLHQDDTKTIKILLFGNFFWGLMFFLMDTHAGLVAVFLSSLRLILSLRYKKNIKVFALLISLIVLLSYFSYQWPTSILPIMTSFMGAYGFMFLSGLWLRIMCLGSSFLWLTYHSSIGAIWGVMTEMFVEVLLVISIYRFSGFHAHRFHVIDTIKHLIHFPSRDTDFWDYMIMRDKNKISTKHNIRNKIHNFSSNMKKRISKKMTRTQKTVSNSVDQVKQTATKVKDKLPEIKA